MDSTHRPAERLAFVDALRGIAALWVVLFHFAMDDQSGAAARFLPAGVVDWIFYRGHLGVWIFFVVSGFVMALAVEDRQVDAAFGARFIVRRMLRLIPPYYASIVIVLALVALRASYRHDPVPWPSLPTLAAHLAFLEGAFGLPEINVVYWTLGIEVQFYVVFAGMLWSGDRLHKTVRHGAAPFHRSRSLLIPAVSLLFLIWPFGLAGPAPPMTFVGYWYAFLAGVLAFRSVAHGGAARLVLGAYGALLVAAAAATHDPAPMVVACTAVAIAAAGAMNRLPTALNWPPAQFVGRVSYSLYLLHDPLVTIVGSITRRAMVAGVVRDLVGLSATLVVSLAAAALFWRFVERPGQAWSRRLTALGRANRR